MSSSAPARVLIIENLTLFRELLIDVVERQPGFSVIADCATLAEGAESCRLHQPNIVLLDWTLADGTGDVLLRSAVAGLPDTRWLVLGTQPNGQTVQTALALGAHGFVMKQSSLDTFREALARLAEGGTFYCPISSSALLDVLRNRTRVNSDGLTERELEVLRLFSAGTPPKIIAEQLRVSAKTIQNQLSSIRQKLDIQETAGLIRYAIRIGLA